MTPPALTQISTDDVLPQPWRNGGGSTRALFAWPPAAPGNAAASGTAATDDWVLRLSLADIGADGPFSAFPGVTRWFTVVDGPGVRLAAPGLSATLTPTSPPLVFDGALAPMAWLTDGPTRDLNLMLRGVAGGLWPAHAGQPWQPPWAWRALFCAHPVRLIVPGQPPRDLPAMTLVHAQGQGQAIRPVPIQPPAHLATPTPEAFDDAWRIEALGGHSAPLAWWLAADLTPTRP